MTLKELYGKISGNYDEALARLASESFIEKFALMYLKDDSYANLAKAIGEGNIPDSFRAVHTMKGVAANLSFTELLTVASRLTEQLRPQTAPADSTLFENVKRVHENIIACLKEYQAEKQG